MKILSAQQTREADAYTIANEPISSVDLMERAARQLYYWFKDNLRRKPEVWILCGKGNNGGDGLVLSRMLLLTGWNVKTIIVEHSPNASADFQVNFKRLESLTSNIHTIKTLNDFIAPNENVVLVDAMLGSGLNSPLKGLILDLVLKLNTLENEVIAIDIPTGLFADDNSQNNLSQVLICDFTLTFQAPKFSFLFPETGVFAGDFEVLDIGLHSDFLNEVESDKFFITENEILKFFKPKSKFDHKGTNGHAVLLGGSLGKMGAVAFAAKSCIKSGAGLVTAEVPKMGLTNLQTIAPEIMSSNTLGENVLEEITIEKGKTYGFGPGMGTDEKTQKAVLATLSNMSQPVVLDADALNILSLNNAWDILPDHCILTPHIGELARMTGKKALGVEALNHAITFAIKQKLIIVLKGAHTAVISPTGKTCFNSTGNPGMATAGSGDVLTGMITSFLAQGYSPEDAAYLGVYFHGLAGDIAAAEKGLSGLTATDILENIPNVLKWFD